MSGVSKSTDKFVNVFVCVGAAVVIFGAWAKILHLSFANAMLTVVNARVAAATPPGAAIAR